MGKMRPEPVPRTRDKKIRVPPDGRCTRCGTLLKWEGDGNFDTTEDGTEVLCAIGSCSCPRTLFLVWPDGRENGATCTQMDPYCECYDSECSCKAIATVHLSHGDYCRDCAQWFFDDLDDFVVCGRRSKSGTVCPDCGRTLDWVDNECWCDCELPHGRRKHWTKPGPDEDGGRLDAGQCICCGLVVNMDDATREVILVDGTALDGAVCRTCLFFCYQRVNPKATPARPDRCHRAELENKLMELMGLETVGGPVGEKREEPRS